MGSFAEGFVSGFDVVDRIKQRRRQMALQEERIGLAKAADARSQEAFELKQEGIEEARERQVKSDRAAELAAIAARDGVENMAVTDVEEMQSLAGFNPNISVLLQNARLLGQKQQSAKDVLEVFQDQRPQGLGGVAAQPAPGEAEQAAQAAAQPEAGPGPDLPLRQITAKQAVSPPGFSENVQDIQGQGPDVGQMGGTVVVPDSELRNLFPGADLNELEAVRGPADPDVVGSEFAGQAPASNRRIPAEIKQKLDDIDANLEGVQKTNALRAVENQLFSEDVQAANRAAEQVAAEAELTRDSVDAMLDRTDSGGQALRQLAADQPEAFANEMFRNRKAIGPVRMTALMDEYGDVFEQNAHNAHAQMRAVSPGPNPQGLPGIDQGTPEFKKLQRNFNNNLQLLQDYHDEWSKQRVASFRADSMPVGSSAIVQETVQSIAEQPDKALPDTNGEIQSKLGQLQKAHRDLRGGARNLSAQQVDKIAWAVARGTLTMQEATDMMTGKAFAPDSNALKVMAHNPATDGDLIVFDPVTGAKKTIVQGTGPAPSIKDQDRLWGKEQNKYISDQMAAPAGSSPEVIEQYRRAENSFRLNMANPEARVQILAATGINTNELHNLSFQQLDIFMARNFQLTNTLPALYDKVNAGWFGLGTKWADIPDNQKPNLANYDQMLIELGGTPVRFQTRAGVDGKQLKSQLAASGNTEAEFLAFLNTAEEIEHMAIVQGQQKAQRSLEQQGTQVGEQRGQ